MERRLKKWKSGKWRKKWKKTINTPGHKTQSHDLKDRSKKPESDVERREVIKSGENKLCISIKNRWIGSLWLLITDQKVEGDMEESGTKWLQKHRSYEKEGISFFFHWREDMLYKAYKILMVGDRILWRAELVKVLDISMLEGSESLPNQKVPKRIFVKFLLL